MNLLKEQGLPVSYPLPDRNNAFVQTIMAPEGIRHGVLFTFAEGKKIRSLTEDMCAGLGDLMARMHSITQQLRLDRADYTPALLIQEPYGHYQRYFNDSLPEMQYLKTIGSHLNAHFDTADLSQLRTGVVHLDMWYDNMAIRDDASITVFDFDFCGNGWLLLDLAYFVMQLFQTEPDKGAYEDKASAFYRGYEAVCPLHEKERRLLPYAGAALWLFYLGVQSRRFDDWSNIFLTENYLKHYTSLLRNWMDYHSID